MVYCTWFLYFFIIPPKGILVVVCTYRCVFTVVAINVDFDAIIIPFIVATS